MHADCALISHKIAASLDSHQLMLMYSMQLCRTQQTQTDISGIFVVADTTSEDLKSQLLPQESHTARSSQSHFLLHRGKIHLSFTWQVLHTPRMPILKAKDCSYSKCQIQFRCSRRVRVQQLRRGSQSL